MLNFFSLKYLLQFSADLDLGNNLSMVLFLMGGYTGKDILALQTLTWHKIADHRQCISSHSSERLYKSVQGSKTAFPYNNLYTESNSTKIFNFIGNKIFATM